MSTQLVVSLAVAAAIVLLALAEGGHDPGALGVAVIAVWVVLAALLVSGRLGFGGLTKPLAIVAAALGLLAAMAAVSTSWASNDAAAFVEINRSLLALGAVLMVGLASRRVAASTWIAGIAIGGVVVALVALGSRLFGFGGDAELAQALPLATERLSYPIGYWNGLGYMMSMTATALFWFAGTAGRRAASAAVAATIPVIVVMFLTSSRGAILMMLIGAVCVGWLIASRSQLTAATIVALPAWLVVVVATAARRSRLEPPLDPGLWGVALAIGILVVALLAARVFPLVAERGLDPRRLKVVGPAGVVAGAVALIAAIGVLGADSFIGTFRGEKITGDVGSASALASTSDRTAFWGTALEAFGEDPVKGIGSGGYATFWNTNGSLSNSVENAHSAPFEELAELGLIGAGLFLTVLAVPLWACRRRLAEAKAVDGRAERSAMGPVLGILLIGTFAVGIDWTWDIPAAAAPFLICIGVVCGRALMPEGAAEGSVIVDPRLAGYEPAEGPARPPMGVLGFGAAGLAVISVWAGIVLAVYSIQLGISDDRLAEGDLDGAANSARAALAVQPWSAEPRLRLAEIEQAGSNFEAARRRAEDAIRASPDDFLAWVLLSGIQLDLGQAEAATNSATRAELLAPLVLPRYKGD